MAEAAMVRRAARDLPTLCTAGFDRSQRMMFAYYLDLAFRSFRRHKMLTALMVLAIAVGIGACMTTFTVLHVLSGDPLPGKSNQLYYPQVDPQDARGMMPGHLPPEQVTQIDGMNLLRAGRAEHQALMTGGAVPIQPDSSTLDPFYVEARYTSADFFTMFDAPFLYGHGWTQADDTARVREVVITRQLDDKLFHGANSVGRTLRIGDTTFRVVGVLDRWRPNPHFYDLTTGSYDYYEQVFLPLQTALGLHFDHNGSNDCWGNGAGGAGGVYPSPTCVWLQFWVQLDSPAQATAYKQFLIHYSDEQRALGRFQRAPNVRLPNLMQWLEYNQVVPGDVRLQAWLAFGFLLVCLVNTIGLMLAKFLRRSVELSVRRALGASRSALFAQLLTEAGLLGLAGGIGGVLLSILGLWLVRRRPSDYAALAHLDPAMLLATFALAIGASLLAGMLPAWHACRVAPAFQLKSNRHGHPAHSHHAAPAQDDHLPVDAGNCVDLRDRVQQPVHDRAPHAAHGHAERHRGAPIGSGPAGTHQGTVGSFCAGTRRSCNAAADPRRGGGRDHQPGAVPRCFVERQCDALADATASNPQRRNLFRREPGAGVRTAIDPGAGSATR
jgi:putative ABC transport system permease protein